MEAKLIKIDRNGTKHYHDWTCPRCGGAGRSDNWWRTGYTCHECGGTGKRRQPKLVKEYTPEYAAKLDAKRQAKWEAEWARLDAERAEREAAERAEREAEEARIKAEKAISKHVGQVGEKIAIKCTYVRTGSWEQPAYAGYGMTTMYCHTFKDADGNVFTWKTQRGICMECGENVDVTGTVKAHSVYKDEKQTELIRCKVTAA